MHTQHNVVLPHHLGWAIVEKMIDQKPTKAKKETHEFIRYASDREP